MKKEAIVKGIRVSAREWQGYGKSKVYFHLDKATCGGAKANTIEFDCEKKEFNYRCRESFLASPKISNVEAKEWEISLKKAFELEL